MWGTLICTLGLLVWLKALQKDRLPEILWALERKWLPQLIFLVRACPSKIPNFFPKSPPSLIASDILEVISDSLVEIHLLKTQTLVRTR